MTYIIYLKVKRKILNFIYKLNGTDKLYNKIYKVHQKIYECNNVYIGDGTVIYNCNFSSSSKGDSFKIGDNCTITGVTFLGHDASPSLFLPELVKSKHVLMGGSRLSYRSPIIIGNNVFIGVGTIILPGTRIGSNVVVGAGSVVKGIVPDNTVVAGNPAKVISSIHEYKRKYHELYINSPGFF
ncbi:TPA: acyltransferase [Vibrio cholerae]|uniref:acyltransferase n=1 Tax=Vibrio cholerae TaxID=666 RepID=UPI002FDC2690